MLARHDDLIRSIPDDNDKDASRDVHSQLQYFQTFISSMRCRSAANEKRMVNEIQLAFNMVAQHDASTSVKIGLATQADSMTMKSIAFVTLTFLPPTFISAIFSMSFFSNSTDSGWVISDKFWIYWAFAIPTTLLTALVWYYLHQFNMPALPIPKEGEQRSMKLFDLELLRIVR
jgi:Mg2+ and Co2+ transporter CorA